MLTRVTFVLAASLLSAATLATASPAHAATNYPWCVQYAWRDKTASAQRAAVLSAWQQCMETARGVGNTCVENPAYIGPGKRPTQTRHRNRR